MNCSSNTYREVLARITEELSKAGVPDASSDARILLEEDSGLDYSHLLMQMNEQLPEETAEKLRVHVTQRKKRIPLQQIIIGLHPVRVKQHYIRVTAQTHL